MTERTKERAEMIDVIRKANDRWNAPEIGLVSREDTIADALVAEGYRRPSDSTELVSRARLEARAMKLAPSGEQVGDTFHAYNWTDKPHRIVYDACRLINELADALDLHGWRGIDSAPKNGSLIDLWAGYEDETNPGQRLENCYWHETRQEWWFYASFKDGAQPLTETWPDHPPLTHWMHRPQPSAPTPAHGEPK